RLLSSLAITAVCLTAIAAAPAAHAEMNASGAQVITNRPPTDPGDARGALSGQENVRDSARYEALVHSNPNFRAVRERKECGPIGDPQMHASCLASFGR
ncbi:MAG TPA: hypothetical protein VGS13_05000, partial [Stellaceae bacterium]|nr:hypothetical protein [Stellaceae bacterium]